MKTFLGICGSLRPASRNMGLLRCAAGVLPADCRLDIADLSAFPFYVEGMETPSCVLAFIEKVKQADALVLAVPEYNYSMAPALKNALDWASRAPGTVLAGKHAAIMGAGGGMGTSRAQYHLRQTCVYLGIRALNKPEVFSNAFSAAFTSDGDVADTDEGRKLRENVRALMAALNDSLQA